jgi:CRP/FNR family transcriptional regulator, cyclic AMP receptor protein
MDSVLPRPNGSGARNATGRGGEPALSSDDVRMLLPAPWFGVVPDAVRDDIVSRASVRRVAEGERIFSRGDAPDGLFVVLEGKVCVSGVTREGRETIFDFYGPGAWIGEVATLTRQVRPYSGHATEPSRVLHLAAADVEELLAAHPTFSRGMLLLESRRVQLLLVALETYSVLSMKARLAMRVLLLADGHGQDTPRGLEIDLPLPHETLARLVGSSRPQVNRIMNDWRREGILEHHYGRIVLKKRARLEGIIRR